MVWWLEQQSPKNASPASSSYSNLISTESVAQKAVFTSQDHEDLAGKYFHYLNDGLY